MVTGLLDTSIIVDLIRGFPDAYQWLQSIDVELGVTRYVWLEVIQGAPNKQKQTAVIKILSDFALVSTTEADTAWAVEALTRTNLAHNVDALDCLIAAPAHRLQIPLYTRNMKHFGPLLGKLARQPY